MPVKSSVALKILPVATLCTVVMATLAVAGCGGDSTTPASAPPPVTVPIAELTPIADCIIDNDNDVVIGNADSGAKPGCENVEMEPSSANPSTFDEIMIANGGTLTISGGNDDNDATASAGEARDSVPFATIAMPVREFCIRKGGTLQIKQIGTQDEPITSKDKVVLEFVGKRDSSSPDLCMGDFRKGIEVMEGGTLLMYGAKGVPARGGVSWTTLAAPAGPAVPGAKAPSSGTTTIALTADVTKFDAAKHGEGWQPDDWIVVATTSYNPFETEFVQIASVKSGGARCSDDPTKTTCGSTVTLREPLKHYHFGSLPPSPADKTCADPLDTTKTQPKFLCDGADRNWGVDERAEVGLISRDIELTADTEPVTTVPPPATSSVHWGGEIMIHPGFKQVVIQGVRLSKFGKDQIRSYPIHFHMAGILGSDQSALIDADSIDHSYNHCVTIHSTSNLTISNLVCARIIGNIFYEELNNAKDNNPADDRVTFDHDLGIGAMSYSFDIYGNAKQSREQLIDKYWWTGDYMTNAECGAYFTCIHYDGFNVPDTDNWLQTVHGSCTKYHEGRTGGFQGYLAPNSDPTSKAACPPPNNPDFRIYIEPANGFWIQNPVTVLTHNAIAGCQGVGRGYWWVPPTNPVMVNNASKGLKFEPLGKFEDNRASGCYSGYYDETEYSIQSSAQLVPHANGQDSSSIVATLDGMTATHNRFRGVWLRPVWFVIRNGHFAANRENVSLVSSGGVDGNAPGVWELLEDSVLVGESQNNVGRWGPCPQQNVWNVPYTGALFGCIASTPPPSNVTPHSGEELGQGYPTPTYNFFGYMLYDGPVRVFHDRFVNFNYNAGWSEDMPCTGDKAGAFYRELDAADCVFLKQYEKTHASPTVPPPPGTIGNPPTPYEGDAALGWFQSNQSEYPTGTVSRELMWVNTNLRHQIYTDYVNVGIFNDGDKNTAIIDEDGTLTGLGVLVPEAATEAATEAAPVHAISLNNLPFNTTSNAVDECLSRGAQNQKNEGRDTSLMSPATMGALEFSNLYPFNPGGGAWPGIFNTHYQFTTFTRDDTLPDGSGGQFHPSITLKGRDGQGMWEPKVSSGYGYTVTVSPIPKGTPGVPDDRNPGKAGMWKWIDVGVADVVDPNISKKHPFFIQLGINYTSLDGSHPANNFTIERGYKSYTGGDVWSGDPALKPYWTALPCVGLDSINNPHPPNLPRPAGDGTCPAAANGNAVTTLKKVDSYAALTNSDGTPNLGVYYYNQATGYLYLYIAQDEPNPVAPSPVGSCKADGSGDPACPNVNAGETYYACPANGCIIYTIAMNDSTYNPGPSVGKPAAANLRPAPANPNQLVVHGTKTVITRDTHLDRQGTPYYTATNGPACTVTQPPAK